MIEIVEDFEFYRYCNVFLCIAIVSWYCNCILLTIFWELFFSYWNITRYIPLQDTAYKKEQSPLLIYAWTANLFMWSFFFLLWKRRKHFVRLFQTIEWGHANHNIYSTGSTSISSILSFKKKTRIWHYCSVQVKYVRQIIGVRLKKRRRRHIYVTPRDTY